MLAANCLVRSLGGEEVQSWREVPPPAPAVVRGDREEEMQNEPRLEVGRDHSEMRVLLETAIGEVMEEGKPIITDGGKLQSSQKSHSVL